MEILAGEGVLQVSYSYDFTRNIWCTCDDRKAGDTGASFLVETAIGDKHGVRNVAKEASWYCLILFNIEIEGFFSRKESKQHRFCRIMAARRSKSGS